MAPVEFLTGDETWATDDLIGFCQAVESIYDAFLACHIARRRMESRRGPRWPEYEGQGGISPWIFGPIDLGRYVLGIHQHVRLVAPEERLKIRSIQMSSSGAISLEGLGEPIQQLRELIKDLRYRNKQEAELGRLEIVEKQLELVLRYGVIDPAQIQELAYDALKGANVLEQLERAGKLKELASGDS